MSLTNRGSSIVVAGLQIYRTNRPLEVHRKCPPQHYFLTLTLVGICHAAKGTSKVYDEMILLTQNWCRYHYCRFMSGCVCALYLCATIEQTHIRPISLFNVAHETKLFVCCVVICGGSHEKPSHFLLIVRPMISYANCATTIVPVPRSVSKKAPIDCICLPRYNL